MPNYVHYTFDGGGVAFWHITESSDELYSLLATTKYDEQLGKMHHKARRTEWIAVRLLVKELFGSESEVAYHATGRPYLKDNAIHISISHTKKFAAVAYHYNRPIGMDVEYVSSRVERIAHRFTSTEEALYIEACSEQQQQLYHLVNWSVKEALYKLFDSSSLADFKNAFHIAPYNLWTDSTLSVKVQSCNHQQGTLLNTERSMVVHFRLFPDFVCAWVFE